MTGLAILGVAMDDSDPQKIAQFASEMGVNYPVLLGTNKVSEAYGDVEYLPTTFYINRQGKIVGKVAGLIGKAEIEDDAKKALDSDSGRTAVNSRRSGPGPPVRRQRTMKLTVCILLLATSLAAQAPGTVQPSVIMAPVQPVQMSPGETRRVELDFRVSSSFHINSNKPHSNLLIPTTLKLMAPKPMEIASIEYPAGEDQTFPFSPE